MEPLAIIGIGCRFPGEVDNLDSFWELLCSGRDPVTDVPADRWDLRRFYDPDPSRPGKTCMRQGAFLSQPLERFDAAFFGLSPREAAHLDPQQRLALEVTWEALEDAGLAPERLAGSKTGVFLGAFALDSLVGQTQQSNRHLMGLHSSTAFTLAILANRLSYAFDFRGPSLGLDTACSSSLVALHYACQSLWHGECSLAVAGGVHVMFRPEYPIALSKGRLLSPDGRCRAFDERANGYVRGEGAGIVVLKPLALAQRDGDPIHALVRATAVNQDGHTPGLTVPSRVAQEELLREVLQRAGISPADIQYVEAHGTGTALGDPIEANALGAVLGEGRDPSRPCLMGSVKTVIGHLEAAAGVAGLIKAVLCLKHRQIPANLHFQQPNPQIDFASLRLRVPQTLQPWPEGPGPALAGVNSFGYGGTNAHVILEEAPREQAATGDSDGAGLTQLLPLSARSHQALRAVAQSWLDHLESSATQAQYSLRDLCYSASRRRGQHDHRLSLVADSPGALAQQLRGYLALGTEAGVNIGQSKGQRPRLVFVYTGMGPQWWAMGRELLRDEPIFRSTLEHLDALFQRHASWSLLAEMLAEESASRMSHPQIAQTTNFALQVALTALWQSWGIYPDAIVGHSVGEVAAAHVAGALNLEDAVRLSFQRSQMLTTKVPAGRMLAVQLSLEEAQHHINGHQDRVSIAAINSPTALTLSGDGETLEGIARVLTAQNLFNRFLQVNIAYHSPHMDRVKDELLACLKGLHPGPTTIPLYSTVTGERIDGSALDAHYWWRNMREPVRLAAALDRLIRQGHDLFLEIGPHPVLAGAIHECLRQRNCVGTVLSSLQRKRPERAALLETLGKLWTVGCPVDWCALYPKGRFVHLPAYPWQREHHWVESRASREDRLGPEGHPLLGIKQNTPEPCWEVELTSPLFPYLTDHRVQGAVVFPGAAYLETCLAVAREVTGREQCAIEELQWHKPLVLDGSAPFLRVSVERQQGKVTIYSRPPGEEDSWTTHATGQLLDINAESVPECLSLEGLRSRCAEQLARTDVYALLKERGLDFGPWFQGIHRLWRGTQEVVAELLLPEASADYCCHPALLDASWQALFIATHTQDLYLPVGVRQARLHRSPGSRCWSHSRITRQTSRIIEGDIWLCDEVGRIQVEMRGLRLQRVASRGEQLPEHWLYTFHWQEQTLQADDGPSFSLDSGQWLILADHTDQGRNLAAVLRQRGHEVSLVLPHQHEQIRQLVRVHGVVYFSGLDTAPSCDSPLNSQQTGLDDCLHVLQLVQDLVERKELPRLWLVTRGAQQVVAGDVPSPGQAVLWGLGRVIRNEHPDLRCSLMDLDPQSPAADMTLLGEELLAGGADTELALRGRKRYIHRLVPGLPNCLNRPVRQVATGETPVRLEGSRPGSLDGLVFRECSRRKPGPGEVELRVLAAGLNFKDVLKGMGMLSERITEGTFSRDQLGNECAGVIVQVGEGVEDLHVGEEVVAWAPGCFATHVTTPATYVFPRLPSLSLEEQATFPVVFLTAYYALHEVARLQPGERVLIHSGTGGVGLAALQVARWLGVEVFATAGSPEKRDFLRSQGIQYVMDSRSLMFAEEVMQWTNGKGVDVVLNSLPGKALSRSLSVLGRYGRFLELGKRDIDENNALSLSPFNNNLSFTAIDIDRLVVDRPEYARRLLMAIRGHLEQGTFQPLPVTTFAATQVEDAFRYLAQARHIGKVALSFERQEIPVTPVDGPLRFRPDASYLITGGLGGVGLEAARWLVRHGARHLVLVGRRGAASVEAEQAVKALKLQGVQVLVAAVDVADATGVKRLLEEVASCMPALRGILHAAMVLEDGFLVQLDRGSFERVMAPKVLGAWNLHVQTLSLPLDFFVLFSSVSSVIGNPGQANYVAANAFLDALAHLRRSHALPALSVNWGALAGAGVLARNQSVARALEQQGIGAIPVPAALETLGHLLQRGLPQVGVLDVDWRRWMHCYPAPGTTPPYADLAEAPPSPASAEEVKSPSGLRTHLLTLEPTDRQDAVQTLLQQIVGRVLRLDATKLDVHQGLDRLGVDSLMAVELQVLIHRECGVDMAVLELMRGPTVAQLALYLLEKLHLAKESETCRA